MVIILAGNIATGKTTIARRIMALAPAFFLVGIDTATPTGKMIIGLFAVLAEYDREEIVQKSRNGQRLAQANGKHIGRPAGVDDEMFKKVVKAYGLGMSVTETVAMTGVSASSVKRYRKAWDEEKR